MNKSTCEFGGILNYNHGVGFKVIFNGSDKNKNAQHYKDMFKWIIESDDFKVKSKNGYFDRKE